jgi:hypothetical protein
MKLKVDDPDIVEVSGESRYLSLTQASITEIAHLYLEDRLLASWDIPKRDLKLLPSIFLPLLYMTDFQRKDMQRDGITYLYADKEDALPVEIEGYPCFETLRTLNDDDYERVRVEINRLKQTMDYVE